MPPAKILTFQWGSVNENNLPVGYWWFLCFPLDCKGSRRPWRAKPVGSWPPSRCLRHNGDRKMLQNQIRKAVWAGWRVFVQERGFISGKHSQEFRFGIVHPIPAFHRKPCIKSNWKRPKTFHMSPVDSRGAPRIKPRGFLFQTTSSSFKKKLAPWKSPLIHRSGGSGLWPPLSLRAHTHLMTPYCEGKIFYTLTLTLEARAHVQSRRSCTTVFFNNVLFVCLFFREIWSELTLLANGVGVNILRENMMQMQTYS